MVHKEWLLNRDIFHSYLDNFGVQPSPFDKLRAGSTQLIAGGTAQHLQLFNLHRTLLFIHRRARPPQMKDVQVFLV